MKLGNGKVAVAHFKYYGFKHIDSTYTGISDSGWDDVLLSKKGLLAYSA